MASSDTIGFIGLGMLGEPIAANLLSAGHALRVFNRTPSKADRLVREGAVQVNDPADVVVPGGVLFTLVWDDDALDEVLRSGDLLARLGENGVHVSMSTVSPSKSRQLSKLHAKFGSKLVEAPVFGRPDTVPDRKLSLALAGPVDAKDRVRPMLADLGAERIFDFGEEPGAAAVVKLLGNFLITSAMSSLDEALSVAIGSGVDLEPVVDLIATTLFPAPMYRGYGSMVAARRGPIPRSPVLLKDLATFRDIAAEAGIDSPVSDSLIEAARVRS